MPSLKNPFFDSLLSHHVTQQMPVAYFYIIVSGISSFAHRRKRLNSFKLAKDVRVTPKIRNEKYRRIIRASVIQTKLIFSSLPVILPTRAMIAATRTETIGLEKIGKLESDAI